MKRLSRWGSAATALAIVPVACSVPDEVTSTPAGAAPRVDTDLVAAVRQDVVESQTLEASVGNGAVVTLPLVLDGLVTWAPAQGAVLRSGDVIVEVAGRPAMLVVGESPLYRPLRLVARGERDEAGTPIGSLQGPDVAQLQRFLIDSGFDDGGRLIVDETFGVSTQRAVRAWQRSVGHPATGVVDSSQMIFMPTELLVSSDLSVGEAFGSFEVTGTTTVLTVIGSTTVREFFPIGGAVEVLTEPPTTGIVSRSSRVTGDDGVRQLVEVTIDGVGPDDLGQSIQVVGSVERFEDVLTVPVRALLAVSGGGWVVEVGDGSGSRRVSIDLISVVGTTAIVSGIQEGDEVVVPL